MSHDDFAFEPIRGLPERLPPGETLLWQGAPSWRGLAKRAFHLRGLGLYFGVLLVWQASAALMDGKAFDQAALATAWLGSLALLALGVMTLLAWLYGRSTVYSITDRRLVIRFGIAIPMSINIPFSTIQSASVKVHSDGTADLPVQLKTGERSGYLVLWPNVRPWCFSRPEPMLRAVPEGQQVAQLLATAMASEAQQPLTAIMGSLRKSNAAASASRPLATAAR